MNDEAVKPPNVAIYLKRIQGFFFGHSNKFEFNMLIANNININTYPY